MIINTENYTITPELVAQIEVMCNAVEKHIKEVGDELNALIGNDFVTRDFIITSGATNADTTLILHMYAKDNKCRIRQVEFIDYKAVFMTPEERTEYLKTIAEKRRINTEKLFKEIAGEN